VVEHTAYAVRGFRCDGKYICILMHRQILNIVDPVELVDHKDHDGLNNQRCNIRECNHSENMRNRSVHCGYKTSKFKGVSWNKLASKWMVYCNGYIGLFVSEKEAALAYNIEAKHIYGEFANLNQIKPILIRRRNV